MAETGERLTVSPRCVGMNDSPRNVRSLATMVVRMFCLGLLTVGCASHQVGLTDNAAQLPNPNLSSPPRHMSSTPLAVGTQPVEAPRFKRANFGWEPKSPQTQRVADWVVHSGDNHGMPFLIVDKVDAKVFVFFADGQLRSAAPALLGLAKGDDSMPGIGDRKLAEINPEDRTTPAGRFVAALGYNFNGKGVLWVDYDNAISLHRVVTSNPKERRLERLATPTPDDNRISFGCINVPENFFNEVVSPTLAGTYGVVYVLPETRSNSEIFASYYDVDPPGEEAKRLTSTKNQGLDAGDPNRM